MNRASFENLIAWQKGMDLAERIYRLTSDFPRDERFGLTAQLRSAAASIPSNIAEGQGRLTTRDFRHFLAQARGSEYEVETQIMLAERLGFAAKADLHDTLLDAREVGRILNGLLRSTLKRPLRHPLLL